ncbi:hypothetical protein [Streptomyces iconiensis]|uniref:DUF3618 domain-containing protein n=1 Tax=Streptomyces iconiensis TaxID=1384038 RepID=A0ABT6ZQ96_9ACTN|nr:hypothetical protein [Streptomyces iconiensis]MDJ1131226.1 hypothetical protein [Streptomyces iconiensis]
MPDEPTLGEVARRLEDVRTDLRDDIREVGSRIDGMVSVEAMGYELRARDETIRRLTERVTEIEQARAEEARRHDADLRTAEDRRRADKRLLVTALLAPVLLLLLQVYVFSKGAGA